MNTSDDIEMERMEASLHQRSEFHQYAMKNDRAYADQFNLLRRRAVIAKDRRFTGESITGFGEHA